MTPVTEAEARKKLCPMTLAATVIAGEANFYPGSCYASDCMAWREAHKQTSREDHSGARDMMNTEAMRTGRHVRREGPPGSLGILILDAVGYCGMAGGPR